MSDFKWRHYQVDVILGCVRGYCKYGISYRDLERSFTRLRNGPEIDHVGLFHLFLSH